MSNARSLSDLITKIVAAFNSNATVPTGAVFDWALNTAPSGFLLCDGSTLLSNTPHTALRTALIDDGFPYGQDGGGNPKLPDARGRVTAGKDDMGGSAAGRLTSAGSGIVGATLGAAGGAQSVALTVNQIPSHNHGGNTGGDNQDHTHSGSTASDGAHVHSLNVGTGDGAQTTNLAIDSNQSASYVSTYSTTDGAHAHSFTTGGISNIHTHAIQSEGGGQAHNNTQPTLVLNKIIKT